LDETEAGGVGPALEGMKEGVVADADAAIVVFGTGDEEGLVTEGVCVVCVVCVGVVCGGGVGVGVEGGFEAAAAKLR